MFLEWISLQSETLGNHRNIQNCKLFFPNYCKWGVNVLSWGHSNPYNSVTPWIITMLKCLDIFLWIALTICNYQSALDRLFPLTRYSFLGTLFSRPWYFCCKSKSTWCDNAFYISVKTSRVEIFLSTFRSAKQQQSLQSVQWFAKSEEFSLWV